MLFLITYCKKECNIGEMMLYEFSTGIKEVKLLDIKEDLCKIAYDNKTQWVPCYWIRNCLEEKSESKEEKSNPGSINYDDF